MLGATSIALQVAAADSGGGIMQLFIVICLEAGLLWLLVRAAGTTSGCRQSRSFDSMARALRAQLRFWIAWTVFTVLSLLALLIAWWMIRERSGNVRAMIEKSHQRQNQAASVEP